MQKLLINGKKELSGKISISGSKNASLPILAATILSHQVKLKNIPLVKDIFTMVELLKFIGLSYLTPISTLLQFELLYFCFLLLV